MATKTEAELLLAKLVSMPTISDDIIANDMALDFVEDYLKRRGMHCRRDRFDGHGTLLASTRKDNQLTPKVLLATHVDVMAASDEMFVLRKEGDKLIGRGVYDMKFSLAGYMQLVDDLQGQLEKYDFCIMVTSDEEYGSVKGINGTRHLIEQGCKPEVCILPDSTAPGWNIETIAKGFWRFDLIAEGKSAHGSRPWEGESASFKLIHALHDVKTYFAEHGPATDTLNIGTIHGGETYNKIPSLMVAGVEIRLMHDESYDKIQAFLKELCAVHGITYKKQIMELPMRTDITSPLVKQYLDSVEEVTGKRPQPHTSFAASDGPYFNAIKVPCIISCPEGGMHHSEEEWISRESFLKFVPILHNYLNSVACSDATRASAPNTAKTTAIAR